MDEIETTSAKNSGLRYLIIGARFFFQPLMTEATDERHIPNQPLGRVPGRLGKDQWKIRIHARGIWLAWGSMAARPWRQA